MNLSWFAHIVVHHPYIIISAVSVMSCTCLIIPFTLKNVQFPSFKDPQLGFSTRGTVISNRLTTYNNLILSTKPAGQLAINPKDVLLHRNYTSNKSKEKKVNKVKKKNLKKKLKNVSKIFINERDNIDNTTVNKWQQIKNLFKNNTKLQPPVFNADGFFCGYPDERYAHVVVQSTNNRDLFSTESLLNICALEQLFINKLYREMCVENTKLTTAECCRPWSLPNYVAILNNRTSCSLITDDDVLNTKQLLINCSEYFHNYDLANCFEKDHCDIPAECAKHDAVFNLLNFLLSNDFVTAVNDTLSNDTQLLETMIFLPLASSTAMLPYYHEIEKVSLEFNGVKVVAMDFGVKSALFDEYLLRDTWLIGSGTIFVLICIWIYTKSLFLTLMTIITIIFSLGIAYFLYVVVFEIKFFPFMNLLAVVVAIGIGSDDAFIFCKIWDVQKRETNSSLVKIMTKTFEHAFVSMFVTTLTTSVAFFGSYVSNCIAIRCFSIFAGTMTIINYLLMLVFFPACIILWERSYCSNITILKTCLIACFQKWFCIRIFIKPKFNLSSTFIKCTALDKLFGTNRENLVFDMIIRFKYVWLTILLVLAILSGVVVLYYPKIQLPETSDIQLFDSKHPFEQYDLIYKHHFYFRRATTYKMPLRFIFGVLPIDNGDHLDPANFGTITLDPTFDISNPEAQVFLKKFCENLRQQPFYEPMPGAFLLNCFVETFIKSMEHRECIDTYTHKNNSPCCKSASFPYEKNVFNKCIVEEMAEIYRTPEYLLMSGRSAGPKFSKDDEHPTIKAIVIEYDSSYSFTLSYDYMNKFYTEVEQWMREQLANAPESMQKGFFTSDFQFYDLQRELSSSTLLEIFISMGLALIVLLFSTLNIYSSLFAVITITCIIFVSISVLILSGWKLGILESVAISTAIGLAVDFSLHYSVNYRLCPDTLKNDRIAATRFSLSHMAGPALMAAITTGAAGAFMLPSLLLPYIQIGIFLVTVMTFSFIYATFFLCSLLAVAGPQGKMGQFSFKCLKCSISKSKPSSTRTNSERNRSLPTSVQDTHELDALTCKIDFKSTNKKLQRSLSSGVQYTPNKFVFTDQSPSATSAITIIMADDN